MIRAVFFDLDGTLYDRDSSILRMAEEQFERFREDLRGITKSRFLERLVGLDGHGHNRVPRLHHVLAEELGFGYGVADQLEALFRTRYPGHCRVLPDTLATLETLRTRGIRLGIITNGPSYWQSSKLEALAIAPYFDAILISEAEGVQKPDARIFARALERCGIQASESMFVGDHPDIDIAGARAAGLMPVWKRMPYWSVPDGVVQIDQLSEILPLCLPVLQVADSVLVVDRDHEGELGTILGISNDGERYLVVFENGARVVLGAESLSHRR
jgi:putative hydrolase of the HAD superfamily